MSSDVLIEKSQSFLEFARKERLQCNFTEAKIILLSSIKEFEIRFDNKELLAELYNELGLNEYMLVNFDEAIQYFTKALDLNCRCAEFFYNRGLITYRLGDFKEALKDIDAALSLNPYFESAISCRKAIPI